jgi:hypothetical protein
MGGFWEFIELGYKSLALIVDCKNYSDFLSPNQVTLTSKYLGERGLGMFGLIISRRGFSRSAEREQRRLWTIDGKMILSLIDADLIKMMSLKEEGDDPSKVIDNANRLFRGSF